jgi:hypothetical protein
MKSILNREQLALKRTLMGLIPVYGKMALNGVHAYTGLLRFVNDAKSLNKKIQAFTSVVDVKDLTRMPSVDGILRIVVNGMLDLSQSSVHRKVLSKRTTVRAAKAADRKLVESRVKSILMEGRAEKYPKLLARRV